VPREVGHRLAAHAEPDEDQRGARSHRRVDDRHRLLETPPEARVAQFAGAFAMSGEVEREPRAAAGGEVVEQREQSLLAAGSRAVQQDGGGRAAAAPVPAAAADAAQSFTVVAVSEGREHLPIDSR
jgi:hypothetical protein